ncbi:MAG TPA: SAM-dependent methyltransferase [Actinomycetota bacterium]|nr:SAM-dependent methyltransferase [Actinomycetota bacterium]
MRRRLLEQLARSRPDLPDPESAITRGLVWVDGVPITNPRSLVLDGSAIVVVEPLALRGSAKMRPALDEFGVDPAGKVCLDVGAAAGGFTSVLLERGAARIFAVDVGHGQLLGSLRQDPRVVNLEATNVAKLDRVLIPEPVELVVVDVSYLSLSGAVAQLDRIKFVADAELVGLVKPMFELRLAEAPTDWESVGRAVTQARPGLEGAGWEFLGSFRSPSPGARGALEAFVHCRKSARD